ncbi:hypothetical protein [Microbulbifer echini]
MFNFYAALFSERPAQMLKKAAQFLHEQPNMRYSPFIKSLSQQERYMTKLAIALIAILVAGCSATTSLTQKSVAEVRQAVTIQNDAKSPVIEYSGPPMQATTDGSDHNLYYYNLRAVESRDGGSIQYRLHIDITYREDWRNYELASFRGGHQVDVTQVDKKVLNCASSISCMLEETVEVTLQEDQITSALERRDNLRVKLKAKSGHRSVVEVSSSYLMGFYAAIVNRQG